MVLPKFEHPDHFWLLAAVPALLLLALGYRNWRRHALQKLGKPPLMAQMLPGFSGPRFWLKQICIAFTLVCLAVAWANPQLGAKRQQATQQSADIFIALDISQSMWARDVAPSRLERAQRFALNLVKSLEGERIGLIFFAGDAFLQMPLSTDYDFSLQSLQTASPELISKQGTAIPAAIQLAASSFDADQGGGRMLILITDGEDQSDEAVDAAVDAAEKGLVVCTVGVGTTIGAHIPLNESAGSGTEQFKRDAQGQVVTTQLNETLLKQVARAGGGSAYNLSQGDRVINNLRREVDRLQKRTVEVRSFTEFESLYQWPLLTAILLLALEPWILFTGKKLDLP